MATPASLPRLTIFVMDTDKEPSPEYRWVINWLRRWEGKVRVANYSTGGWEHCWDVEGPEVALREVPEELHCSSAWADPPADPHQRKSKRHGRK